MKELIIFIALIVPILNQIDTSKMFLIYFSRSGNTEMFAKYILENIDIPSYRIIPVNEYPSLEETLVLAQTELDTEARPEIQNPLTNVNISEYDIILLGHPLWHSHLPRIVVNQLEKLDLTGKTIYPFNTYGSLGIGETNSDIKKFAKGAIVKNGFPIIDYSIKIREESEGQIKKWLNKNFNPNYKDESDARESSIVDSFKFINIKYSLLIGLLLLF